MEIARHWRLRKTRYGNAWGGLIGEKCPHCDTLMFPPRDICINDKCRRGTLPTNLDIQIGAPDPEFPSKLQPILARKLS